MLYTSPLDSRLDSCRVVESDQSPRVKVLSPRAMQVLELLACGFSNAEIGREIKSTSKTVANYVTDIYISLGVANRVSAVVVALQRRKIKLSSLTVAQRNESELRKFEIEES